MIRELDQECLRSVSKQNWMEIKRSWIWIVFGVITGLWHNVASNIAYYVHTPQEPLWDIGFHIFPEYEPIEDVTEIMLILCLTGTGLFTLLPSFMNNPKHITSMLIVVRICQISGFTGILRTISFLSTSLPSPSHHCRPESTDYFPPSDASEIMSRMDPISGCGDLIFSGHTSNTLLMTLTVSHYSYFLLPRWWKWITFGLCVPFVITMASFIIIAQNHYTVDVVVALYTVPLLYSFLCNVLPDTVHEINTDSMDAIMSRDDIALVVRAT